MREEGLGAYARICAHPEPVRYLPGTMTPEQTEEQMARFAVTGRSGVWVVGYRR